MVYSACILLRGSISVVCELDVESVWGGVCVCACVRVCVCVQCFAILPRLVANCWVQAVLPT